MSYRSNHPHRPDPRVGGVIDAIENALRLRVRREASEREVDQRVSIETDEQGFTIATSEGPPRQAAVWHKDRPNAPISYCPDVPTREFARAATALRKAGN